MRLIITSLCILCLISPAHSLEWTQKECEMAGGYYQSTGSACKGTCDYERATEPMACITVVVPSCQCPTTQCWNPQAKRCEPTKMPEQGDII